MGKSLQPQNAIAVRQPANTPPAAGSPAPNEPVTAESLGWQLRAALPPLRLHSVSLYDEQANVLWLSEGALGPDEHNVVVEAIDALGNDTTLNCYESGLEDGRVAIFLPVRSPQGGLVGLAMILADIKSVGDGVIERMVTPNIRSIMQRVAVLLRPAQPRSVQGESPLQILELAPDVADAPVQAVAPKGVAPKSTAPVSALTAPGGRNVPVAPAAPVNRAPPVVLSAQAVDDILEFELTPDPPAPVRNSQTQRLPALAAVNGVDLSLDFPSDKPAAKPISVAAVPEVTPVRTAGPARSGPLATIDDSLDLKLPSMEPAAPPPAIFAGNVAPFPSPVSAGPSGVTPAPATIPTVGAAPMVRAAVASTLPPAAAIPTLGAPPQATPAPTPPAAPVPLANLSATSTSKALGSSATGTGKVLAATTGTSKALAATSTSRVLTLPEGMNLLLEVQPFSKLRAGGRTRRYEVLARSSHPNRVPPGLDKIALQQLLTWMGSNRAAWSLEPTSFTLNLSISTLEDERFPQFVASNLKANGIAPDNIGFEIAEPLCLQRRAQVERFITLCDKLGCFVVIDDFSLDSSIVSLLRSKALRLVKIDPKLTSVALKDKLAQAMVVAIAQAAKVLGIHCAAKRVDSQAAMQWLTAIGCDFAQGAALAQVQPLESLGTPPAATPGQSA
ncbi:MAG: hypothetical protein JWO04_4331 [Gammaproteobacteria bacterium]|nr:hypothetical protein [Gammaproteobacteria bacterium]